jgi:hypothetical protein
LKYIPEKNLPRGLRVNGLKESGDGVARAASRFGLS